MRTEIRCLRTEFGRGGNERKFDPTQKLGNVLTESKY
jgi:hypothetical protein